MSFTYREVLEEFVAAQVMAVRRVSTDEDDIEARRVAWRARQQLRGLCRSCRAPTVPGRRSCERHRKLNAARARAANAKWNAAWRP